MSALSTHGLPAVVENLTEDVPVTRDNPLYEECRAQYLRLAELSLFHERHAPFTNANEFQRSKWPICEWALEVLGEIPREIEVVERRLLSVQDVLKRKGELYPDALPIQVEKNAQTVARCLWVLGLGPSVYQPIYQQFRKLNEKEQKEVMSFISTSAITAILQIQKIRPKWMTGLNYEQLYGIYTMRRSLSPKSKTTSVLKQIAHLAIPHPIENNEHFSLVVDAALQELSMRPRVVLECHRSYKACFEVSQVHGGINGMSNKMFQARTRQKPDLFRSDMNPTKDIPVFTEDIAQRGYEQQKEGMHLLEIAMRQLKHQGTPKLLGCVIEERGMKSRIPLVPQWCSAIVAAALGDCFRPYLARFCASTYRGQIHNRDRDIPKWWYSGDFRNSSDNLKFQKLKIVGEKMLHNCTWPAQFFPYKQDLLDCLDILLGEHLVYEIDSDEMRHVVRPRFFEKETEPVPTNDSHWRLNHEGWYHHIDEDVQAKTGFWDPWDDWKGPHPRHPFETDGEFLHRLQRLESRHHAYIHKRRPFPTWTGTHGETATIGPVTRPLRFQELLLKKSDLDHYPHLRTARGVHMCYGLSFPIMSFMTWVCHFEMIRNVIPGLPPARKRNRYGFDITGDDNSSGHEDKKSMDELEGHFVDKGFDLNPDKSFVSQLGYVHAEGVYLFPIIGTQKRQRLDITSPKMKVLFPEQGGANWSELPQIVFNTFKTCSPEIQIRAQSLLYSRYYQSYKKCLDEKIDLFSLPRNPILPIRFTNKEPDNGMLGPVLLGYLKEINSLFVNKARAPRALRTMEDVASIVSFCGEEPNHLLPSIPDAALTKDYTYSQFTEIALQWFTEPPWRVLQVPARPIKVTAEQVIDRFKKIPNKRGHINLKDIPKYEQIGVYISSSIEDLTKGFHWVPYKERNNLREHWHLAKQFLVVDLRNTPTRGLIGFDYADIISAFEDYFDLGPNEPVYLVDDWLSGTERRYGIHWVLKGYPNADKTIIDLCRRGGKAWKRVITADRDLTRKIKNYKPIEVISFIDYNDFPLKQRTNWADLEEIKGDPRRKATTWYADLKKILRSKVNRGLDPWTDKHVLAVATRIPANELPGIIVRLGGRPNDRWDSFRVGLNAEIEREIFEYEKHNMPLPKHFTSEMKQLPKPQMAPPRYPVDFELDSELKKRARTQADIIKAELARQSKKAPQKKTFMNIRAPAFTPLKATAAAFVPGASLTRRTEEKAHPPLQSRGRGKPTGVRGRGRMKAAPTRGGRSDRENWR